MSMEHPEIIERDGRKYAVLPLVEYESLLDDLDGLEDVRAYHKAKAEPGEYLPLEFVERWLLARHPGEAIKLWAGYRKMTQKKLAEKAGVSSAHLSEIIKGKKAGSLKTLQALVAALDITMDDIV